MAQDNLKRKLKLKAIEMAFTTETTNDYSLRVTPAYSLETGDVAQYTVTHNNLTLDPALLAMYIDMAHKSMVELLSSGYTLRTSLGNFRLVAGGVLMESELSGAPPRDRLRLGVAYSMSKEMRRALADTQIDVEIQKATIGPQIYAVVSTHDAENPAAVSRGEAVPIQAGQTCIIKGRNIKVGGTDDAQGENIGVTITRTDDGSGQTYFYPPSRLFPNSARRVGFVMPADAPEGSQWSVSICTGLGNNGQPVKKPRVTNMPYNFVIGQVGDDD